MQSLRMKASVRKKSKNNIKKKNEEMKKGKKERGTERPEREREGEEGKSRCSWLNSRQTYLLNGRGTTAQHHLAPPGQFQKPRPQRLLQRIHERLAIDHEAAAGHPWLVHPTWHGVRRRGALHAEWRHAIQPSLDLTLALHLWRKVTRQSETRKCTASLSDALHPIWFELYSSHLSKVEGSIYRRRN